MKEFCVVVSIVSLVVIVVLLFSLVYNLTSYCEYKKLSNLNRVGYDLETYIELKRAIPKMFHITNFEIVFFKDKHIVIKLGQNYFSIDNDNSSLIYLFNKNSCLLEKIESVLS